MSQDDSLEPVTITDKRRIDPETGEIRDPNTGPAPSGPAPDPDPDSTESEGSDKIAELTADLQRVQADFTNYRKRAMRDQQVAGERSKATVIAALLGVLDDLDRARTHGDLESGPFKAVADKLVNALEGLGLSAFGAEGDEFDPSLHEAVQHEGDGSAPVVGTVMRRGYKVGDLVVRHAMVGVVDTVGDSPVTPLAAENADVDSDQPAESEE